MEKKVEPKCDPAKDRTIQTLIEFIISGKPYYLPRGFYLIKDLKKMAGVPECHVLAEIRGDDIDTLTDDTATHLCGGEIFKPFPGKGDAS